MRRILIVLFFLFMLVMTWIPASGQTTATQSADILRNLKSSTNATHRHYVGATRLRPRLAPIPRTAASKPVRRDPRAYRLDGTRKDQPRHIYGFTPADWQFWVQRWEVRR